MGAGKGYVHATRRQRTSFFLGTGIALVLLAILLAGCSRTPANLSGTYLNITPNEDDLLQIVEQTDHSIVGRMQIVSLKPGAQKVSTTDLSVTGATNNGVVVLTLENADVGFLGGLFKLHVSGPAEGDRIMLSGWSKQPGPPVVFVKGDFSTFEAETERLAGIADQTKMKDARIAAYDQRVEAYKQHLADVTRLSGVLASAAEKMQKTTAALKTLPGKYQAVTAKMEQMLAKEREMPRACCVRSNESFQIDAVSFDFNDMHFALRNTEFSWQYSKGQVHIDVPESDIASAQAFCKEEYPGCTRFAGTLSEVKAAGHALDEAFASDEASWQAEKAKQQALQRDASQLLRPTQ